MIVRPRILLLALFLIGLTSVTGTAFAAQGTWVQPSRVIAASDKGWQQDARVAVASDKTAIAVWLVEHPNKEGSDDNTNSVMAAVRPPNGKFGKPFDLSGDAHGIWNLSVAAAGSDITVLWQRKDNYSVITRTRPAGGPFGPKVRLNDQGETWKPYEPELAGGADGTTAVSWRQPRSTPSIVAQASIRPPGGVFGAPVDLMADQANATANSTALAVADDGAVVVAWQQYGQGIRVAERPAGGSFGSPVGLTGSQTGYWPVAGIAPDGTTTVAWTGSEGNTGGIFATTQQPGEDFPAASRVARTEDPRESEMAVAGDGRITIVWPEWVRGGDPDYGYFDDTISKMVSWIPGQAKTVKRLGTASGWNFGGASVSGSADGSTTVVWPDRYGRDAGVKASTWTPGGEFSDPVRISTDLPDMVNVATGPDGNAVADWIAYRQSSVVVGTSSTVPAYCGRSSMTLGKVKRNPRNGTAWMLVKLGSRGKVSTLRSPWIKPMTTRAPKAGTYRVKVVPKGPARRLLRRTGWAEVKVGFRFDPTAVPCQNVKASRQIVLIRQVRKSR